MFGWILSGQIHKLEEIQIVRFINICENLELEERKTYSLSKQLRQFWELKEIEGRPEAQYTQQEAECESNFKRTYMKEHLGRYCVQYPLQPAVFTLEESKQLAEKRFIALEGKLKRDAHLRNQYIDFIKEYCLLGHVELRSDIDINQSSFPQIFLPHHAMIYTDSSTTELSIVFDVSTRITNRTLLNEVTMIDPLTQEKLSSILLRCRCHKFAMTASIEKLKLRTIIVICKTFYGVKNLANYYNFIN